MATRILAVHLAADQLSFAVAESTLRSLRVTALGRVAADSDAVADIVTERGWDRVVASLPAEAAVFRLLEFPFSDRRRLSQAVGPALEEHVPMTLEESAVAFDLCSSQKPGQVLAVMAASATVQSHLETLARYGIVPERLIWAPSATLELYRLAAGADATFTAVDVGEDGAVVACFEGQGLIGLRVLPHAEPDVLIRNLGWSLRALDPSSPRVIIGGSASTELGGSLAETLDGMAVEQLPFDCPVELEEAARPGWRASATALGLVLAARGDLAPPVVRFSTGSEGRVAATELGEAGRRVGPWAAATVACLLLAGGLDYTRLWQHSQRLDERAETLFRAVMPEGAGGPGKRLKMELRAAELEQRRAELAGPGGHASPLAVLAEMSSSVPKQLAVEFDSYTYDPPSVRLRGQGASFEAVTRLQQTLQASDKFSDVAVNDVRAAASGDGVVFEMTLTLGDKQQAA